jgi:uroporphyrinogen-III synthase
MNSRPVALLQLCALGADSEALRSAGYHVDIVPDESSTQGLVRHLVKLGQAQGARVLCPVPLVSGMLAATLGHCTV